MATPLRSKGELAGFPGALVNDGVALLAMGCTAWLRLAGLSDPMKRELLDLLLDRCTWANGKLVGIFKSPFDILSEYAAIIRETAGGDAKREAEAMIERLLKALEYPISEERRLIARDNAILRVRDGHQGRTVRLEQRGMNSVEAASPQSGLGRQHDVQDAPLLG